MQNYANRSGSSGVRSFSISNDSITVSFNGTSRSYTYSYSSAGQTHVEHMKKLAVSGSGLNSYINRYVKNLYD